MFGSESLKKAIATTQLSAMLVVGLVAIAPDAAFAQGFGDMLYSPGQGASTRTLRNPLIPTASSADPYQAPYEGQPPPVGDGSMPAPEIRGDLGGPQGVYSGMADPTHGNIFPTRQGPQGYGPENYVPGAGRIGTQNGQQQGMFDFGQGQQYGRGMGPGGPSNGSFWVNQGGPAPDATGMGPGGKNGGNGLINNGGAAGDARGMGPGGSSNGTGWVNNGGAAPDATGMGPGGKNGGNGIVNNGGAAGDARGMGGGGKSNGVGVVNNGGNNGGVGVVNNGGPAPGAQGQGDRLFSHQRQPNRYDFQGPLPTVRTFSRYLVILGVTSATVFMALAAWGMILGSRDGGSRVIGAAAGLLLLLAGYTIWKIVQMNTFHANSTGWESHYRDGSRQNVPGPGTPQPNNGPFQGPQNPNGGGGNPNGGGGNPNGGNPNGGNPNGGGPFAGGGNPNGGGGNPNGGGGNPNGGGGPIPNPGGSPNPAQPGGNPNPNPGGGGFIPILGGN